MFRSTYDLLTLKAFRPDIRDYRIPFSKRDLKEPLLGISLHRSGAILCCIEPSERKAPTIRDVVELDTATDEEIQEEVVQYARKHYLRYAIGLLSYDFSIELQSLKSEPTPALLREEPASLFLSGVEKASCYSAISQPGDPKQALVFNYNQAAVKRVEALSKRSPISFLQIGGGVEWGLSTWLENPSFDPSRRSVDLVIYDAPTVTILQLDGQSFSPNIFCRTDSSGALPEESAIIRRGLERYLRSGSHVVFIDLSMPQSESSPVSGLVELLEDLVGKEDLTVEPSRHPLELILREDAA